MEKWHIVSLVICVFGFIREIRPSEPFVTDYLIYPWRNITADEVNRLVFPIGTYSYAVQLVIIFLITDYLKYKPIIILSGISGIVVWSMLVWTKSLQSLQILEIFYGSYMASEVGYFTYIYAKVDKLHYLKITSHARAAVLVGKFAAGSLGQILVYTNASNYRELHCITLGAQICASIWALFIPSVKSSQYFHQRITQTDVENDDGKNVEAMGNIGNNSKIKNAFNLFKSHFISSYTNYNVIIWSVWYSVAMCGYLQIISYIQVLWTTIDNSGVAWNGAVEAGNTLIGAFAALLAGRIPLESIGNSKKYFGLFIIAVLKVIAISVATHFGDRTVSYIGYSIFCILFAFAITVVSAEIAHHITDDCYGLVFGLNTLIALILQTLLTVTIVSESLFTLSIFQQYTVYSCYFGVLGVFYLISIIINLCFKKEVELVET